MDSPLYGIRIVHFDISVASVRHPVPMRVPDVLWPVLSPAANVKLSTSATMATLNLFRLSCVPSLMAPHLWMHPATRRRFVATASSAADGAAFSSYYTSKIVESGANAELPRSKPKQKPVAGVDQNNLVDPWTLADSDSRFAELLGVQLHYKIAQPPFDHESTETKASLDNSEKTNGATSAMKTGVPAVLLHGFGASLFSWQRVLKPLAAIIGSNVVAFDRPAFGLTSRPQLSPGGVQDARRPNPYGMQFSARATLSFVEFLHAQQVILIGHSAGCLVALQAYLDAPEKVAAIIFVAPALAAPLIVDEFKKAVTAPDPGEEQASGRVDLHSEKKFRLADIISTARDAIWWGLIQVLKVLRIINAAVQALFQTLLPEKIEARVGSEIRILRERLVTAVIRSSLATWLIRVFMDRFGTRGVRMAWYDPLKADDDVLQGYTKPLQCKDWDKALLEFVLAMAVSPYGSMKSENPLGKRLEEVTCPVLVVTGDTDRLVPAWNARRLASALPNAEFALIQQCGHVPQEETPQKFLSIIESFIARVVHSEAIPVPVP